MYVLLHSLLLCYNSLFTQKWTLVRKWKENALKQGLDRFTRTANINEFIKHEILIPFFYTPFIHIKGHH